MCRSFKPGWRSVHSPCRYGGEKFDATVLDSPQTVQARRLGFRVVADGVELGIPFLQGGLVTKRAYIRANEDTVRRVVRVIVEAIHYAKTNREAALAVMKKYLHIQDRDALEDAYESFVVKQFPGFLTSCPPPSRSSSTSPPCAILAPRPPTLRDSSICASSENSSRAELINQLYSQTALRAPSHMTVREAFDHSE